MMFSQDRALDADIFGSIERLIQFWLMENGCFSFSTFNIGTLRNSGVAQNRVAQILCEMTFALYCTKCCFFSRKFLRSVSQKLCKSLPFFTNLSAFGFLVSTICSYSSITFLGFISNLIKLHC